MFICVRGTKCCVCTAGTGLNQKVTSARYSKFKMNIIGHNSILLAYAINKTCIRILHCCRHYRVYQIRRCDTRVNILCSRGFNVFQFRVSIWQYTADKGTGGATDLALTCGGLAGCGVVCVPVRTCGTGRRTRRIIICCTGTGGARRAICHVPRITYVRASVGFGVASICTV